MTLPSRRDLILAYVTLPHLAPPGFVTVAAEAGYQGISVRLVPANPPVEQPFPMLGVSAMMDETLSRLADTGLYVNDIEVLRLKAELDLEPLLPVFEASARLQARNILVLSDDDNEARVAENLARIAEAAAPFGLRTCFEFMIYVGIKTIAQAERILAMTGRPDIGLVIDPLHLERAGGTPEDVARLDPASIASLQFCDAGTRPDISDLAAVVAEARGGRMIPGTGTLPLMELVAACPADVPISVEVPIKRMMETMDDLAIARIMKEATSAMLARAPT